MILPEIPEQVKKEFSKQNWKMIASLEWTCEDWVDYYEGISFALWKIARRHRSKPKEPAIDFQI